MYKNEDYKFDLFHEHDTLIQLILVFFTFFSASFLLIYGLKNRMIFRKNLYKYLYFIYFVYLCFVAIATISKLYLN